MRATIVIAAAVVWSVIAALLFGCACCDVVAGVSTSEASNDCDQVNLQNQTMGLSVLNSGIDLVLKSSNLQKKLLAAIDPMVIRNETLEPTPLKILGVEYQVTTLVKVIQVSGASTAKPRHVNATSPSTVVIGADFEGQIWMNGSLHLTIEQLHRKWWQFCWTHAWSLNLKECKPAQVDVDVRIAWLKPTFTVDAQLVILQCPHTTDAEKEKDGGSDSDSNAPKCSDLGITDFISAVLRHSSLEKLEERVLRRVKQLAVLKVDFAFDELSELDVRFQDSNLFTRAVMTKLAQFSKSQVNKKGAAYRAMVDASEQVMNSTANGLIEDRVGSRFGGTCYDS